jgi:hypothetical protein
MTSTPVETILTLNIIPSGGPPRSWSLHHSATGVQRRVTSTRVERTSGSGGVFWDVPDDLHRRGEDSFDKDFTAEDIG